MSDLAPVTRDPDLAFITQHLFTAVLWVDEALRIKWLNAQAEQLLAISAGRLMNQSILLLLGTDAATLAPASSDAQEPCSLAERFARAQQYQQPFIDHDHAINMAMSEGAPIMVDYSVTPISHNGQAHFIIEMWGKDRQSRISEEARQQQQYQVARHMLRAVAHEVKNPLAGIRGAAQLLQRHLTKLPLAQPPLGHDMPADTSISLAAKKLNAYTDIIITETDRLTQLIGQLLGSHQLPKWQSLNIHEPIEHVLTLIASQYPRITLQRDYDLSLPELTADKDQLIQVFLNVFNNACEAMTEQTSAPTRNPHQAEYKTAEHDYYPTLHIQTRVVFQHTIGSYQHKQVLCVTISDNGAGIDPSLIEQIFFPMVTSRAAGTGLGLSIVQDIISRHHGMITVQSTQGKTQFMLYLPFSPPA